MTFSINEMNVENNAQRPQMRVAVNGRACTVARLRRRAEAKACVRQSRRVRAKFSNSG